MAYSLRKFIQTNHNRRTSFRLGSTSLQQIAYPKVALCGGGISNCVAANYLANHGIESHIFEVGRGVGGRTATRRIGEYFFDHGAQVIEQPRSKDFTELIQSWIGKCWIDKWTGSFGRGIIDHDELKIVQDSAVRYVAIPAMSSLCKHLAEHENIHCHFETKANPILTEFDGLKKWTVHGQEFDWIVVSDRSIGADILKGQPEGRFGLESLKEGYVEPLQSVFLPVPVLAMMLTLPGRFPKSFFPFDSVTFANHPSISLISRETSKPQRDRNDSKECWVIHSTSEFAHKVMREVSELPDDQTISFEERKRRVNDRSLREILPEFIDVMQTVAVSSTVIDGPNSDRSNITEDIVERILSGAEIIRTHRWSAAFPSVSRSLVDVLDKKNYVDRGGCNSYVDTDLQFAACGDYLSENRHIFGKIEGATLSGLFAAKGILQSLQK